MSDCGVCIGFDAAYTSDWIFETLTVARCELRCCECDDAIPAGVLFEFACGDVDGGGERWTSETCLECAEISTAFSCEGRTYGGGLWDALYEIQRDGEGIGIGCFNRLRTAAAKKKLADRVREWVMAE